MDIFYNLGFILVFFYVDFFGGLRSGSKDFVEEVTFVLFVRVFWVGVEVFVRCMYVYVEVLE